MFSRELVAGKGSHTHNLLPKHPKTNVYTPMDECVCVCVCIGMRTNNFGGLTGIENSLTTAASSRFSDRPYLKGIRLRIKSREHT